MKKRIIFISLLIVCFRWLVGNDENHSYRIGQHTYVIPEKYILDDGAFSWINQVLGLDQSKEHVFLTMDSIKGVSFLGITAVSPIERARFLSSHSLQIYSLLWNAKGIYSGRKVIPHEESGYYLVFNPGGRLFDIFLIAPNPEEEMPKNLQKLFAASCISDNKIIESVTSARCDRDIVLSDVVLEVSFSFDSLAHIKEIDQQVIDLVYQWRNRATP